MGGLAGSTLVTVTGRHFGSKNVPLSVEIGGVACLETTWVNSTTLKCLTPPGSGADLCVTARVGEHVSCPAGGPKFTYVGTAITSVNPTCGPVYGGTKLTIRGTNLGTELMHARVTVGGVPCKDVEYKSDSVIKCVTPESIPGPAKVLVSVMQNCAEGSFMYKAPEVWGLHPDHGPQYGNVRVQVHGDFLGTEERPANITIGGMPCRDVEFRTEQNLVCTAPSHHAGAAKVVASTHAVSSARCAMFNYETPRVFSIDPATGPTYGRQVIKLYGANFGQAPEQKPDVFVGGVRCLKTAWKNEREMECLVPPGMEGPSAVTVADQHLHKETAVIFMYEPPTIAALTPDRGSTAGKYELTLHGKWFGRDHGVMFPTVTVGGAKCAGVRFVGEHELRCEAPAGRPGAADVQVSVMGKLSPSTPHTLYTYQGPVVRAVHPPRGPTYGGYRISVVGFNLGSRKELPRVMVGRQECHDVRFVAEGEVSCRVPAAAAGTTAVSATLQGQTVALHSAQFTYEAPVVHHLDPAAGPSYGGNLLVVSGANFGASADMQPEVTVDGHPCEESTWVSETQVKCVVPAAQRHLGAVSVRVRVMDQTSERCKAGMPGCAAYEYQGPTVSHLEPVRGPTYGGTRLTIHGANLGRKGDDRAQPTISIGKQLCENVKVVDDGEVTCVAPASDAGPEELVVNVRDMTTSEHGVFLYDPPAVRAVEPATAPTYGGEEVTISGTNFGHAGMQPTAYFGGRACDATVRVSEGEVRCKVPAGEAGMAAVVVEVGDQASDRNAQLFEYKPPLVSSVTPPRAPSYGAAWVTIRGKRFGSSPHLGQYATVGGSACSKTLWYSDSEIRCLLPAGRPGLEHVVVGVGDAESAPEAVFTYDPPVVQSVAPPRGPSYGNNVIDVYGRNFGSKELKPQVYVGSLPCVTTDFESDHHLRCRVPAAQVGRLGVADVVVVVSGDARSTSSVHYEYVGPTVSHVEPSLGPVYGGSEITVFGDGFGTGPDAVEAFVGGKACQSTTYVKETEVKCVTPAGLATGKPALVSVRVGAHRSYTRGAEARFLYEAPVVSHVSPMSGPSYGGNKIHVHGRNFGADYQHVRVTVGGRPCAELEHLSNTHLSCVVPPGAGEHNELVVAVDDYSSPRNALWYSYRPPTVTRVVPAIVPTYGHVWVDVLGANFGARAQRPQAFVGGVECVRTEYVSEEHLRCLAPAATKNEEAQQNVVVHVRDGAAAGPRPTFSYSSGEHKMVTYKPVRASAVHPTHGPVYGGTKVRVSGLNLGEPQADGLQPIVTVGGVPCEVLELTSNRSLTCRTAANTAGDKAVVVTVMDLASAPLDAGFTYDRPEVDSVAPDHGPVYGGTELRVRGRNLGAPAVRVQVLVDGQPCLKSWLVASGEEVACITPPDAATNETAAGAGGDRAVTVVAGAVTSDESDAVFRYDGPTVAGVTPNHGPSYGGQEVVVTGQFLGDGEVDVAAYVGGVACAKTRWISPVRVACVTPAMRRSASVLGSSVTVRVGSHNSPVHPGATYRYEAPSVRTVVPSTGATYGTQLVSVRGTNLGNAANKPVVKFNDVPCLDVRVVSSHNVQCKLPPGKPGPAQVEVTVRDESSEASDAFTYQAPSVEKVMPAYGASYGNQLITLVGSNLGTQELQPKVWIGGVPCRDTVFVSSAVLKCRTPPGNGASRDVVVTVSGETSADASNGEEKRATFSFSNDKSATFSYQEPQVDRVSPAAGPDYGHNEITVHGRGFGTKETHAVVAVGGVPCLRTRYVSDTMLRCTVPPLPASPCPRCGKHKADDPAREFDVTVFVLGHESRAASGKRGRFAYHPIRVDAVAPNYAPTYGNTTVTVRGANFGEKEGALSPTIYLGGLPCLRTERVAEGEARCVVPPNTCGNVSLTVSVLDHTSPAGEASFQYQAPQVQRVVPNRGPTYGGQVVHIFGTHFGSAELPPIAYVGGQPCLSSRLVNPYKIECVTPPGRMTQENQCVSVSVGGETSSTNELFAYVAPFVRTLSTHTGYESGHQKVVIDGEWFGRKEEHTVASVGGVPCARTVRESETRVVCYTPAGCGDDNNMVVTVDGVSSNQTHLFAYEPLRVSRVAPFRGSTAGGWVARIYGTGFGVAADAPVAYIGRQACAQTYYVSPHRLDCVVPPGEGGDLSVMVRVHHLSSEDNSMFQYAPPMVDEVVPQVASTRGGDRVTLRGDGFGRKEAKAVAFVGGVACAHTEWVSHHELVCTVPPGVGADRCLQVEVDDQVSEPGDGGARLSYRAPSLTEVEAGPTAGHKPIVLQGMNLGPDVSTRPALLARGEKEIEASVRAGIKAANETERQHKVKKATEIAARKAMRLRNTAAERLMDATSRRIRMAQELHAKGVGEAARQENRKEMEVLRYEALAAQAEAKAKRAASRAEAEELADAALKDARDANNYARQTRDALAESRREAAREAYKQYRKALRQTESARDSQEAAEEAMRMHADHVRMEGQRERDASAKAALESERVAAEKRAAHLAKEHEDAALADHAQRRAAVADAAERVAAARAQTAAERKRAGAEWTRLDGNAKRNLLPNGRGLDVDENEAPNAKPWHYVDRRGVVEARPHRNDQQAFEDVHGARGDDYAQGLPSGGEVRQEATRYVTSEEPLPEGVSREDRVREAKPVVAQVPGESVDDVANQMAQEAAQRAKARSPLGDGSQVRKSLRVAEKKATKAVGARPLLDDDSAATDALGDVMKAKKPRVKEGVADVKRALAGGEWDWTAPALVEEAEDEKAADLGLSAMSRLGAKALARRARRNVAVTSGVAMGDQEAQETAAAGSGSEAGTVFKISTADASGEGGVPPAETVVGEILSQEAAAERGEEAAYHALKVTIDGKECEEPEALDHDRIRCLVPPGVGGSKTVRLTVGGQTFEGEGMYSYAGAVVEHVEPSPAPRGGDVVSLHGYNFGPWKSEISVHVGSAVCTDVQWVSDNLIKCTAPPGIGARRPVSVTVAGVRGMDYKVWDYASPVVDSVSPQDGHTRGEYDVRVTGRNFGTMENALSITVGGRLCLESRWVSNTEAVCRAPAGAGARQPVVVRVGGQPSKPEHSGAFTYYAPVVLGYEEERPPAVGGTEITVRGKNFGTSQDTHIVRVGGVKAPSVSVVSSKELLVVVPPGAGKDLDLEVEANGQRNREWAHFTYARPEVTRVAPARAAAVGGGHVRVFGRHFGPQARKPTVLLGKDLPCADTKWVSDGELICVVPAGAGAHRRVLVDAGGQRSLPSESEDAVFSYNAPQVTQVSPATAPAVGGDEVSLMGVHFGPWAGRVTAFVGGRKCSRTTLVSDSELRCVLPAGVGKDVAVHVAAGGQAGPRVRLFTYHAPTVLHVKPDHAPAKGGSRVTLRGANFGPRNAAVTAFVGERPCQRTVWVGDAELECVVPEGVGGKLQVHVRAGNQGSRGVAHFSYDRPVVRSVDQGSPTRGGSLANIYGANFGGSDHSPRVTVGGRACDSVVWVDDGTLQCAVPKGAGRDQPVVVYVGGQHNKLSRKALFAYEAPVIEAVAPLAADPGAHERVTITGRNFGMQPGAVAKIGGRKCDRTIWRSDNVVQCIAPEGFGSAAEVDVVVSGVEAYNKGVFAYSAPVPEKVIPARSVANVPVRITGRNLPSGKGPSHDVRVTIGGRECHAATVVGEGEIECVVPPGTGHAVSVAVTVDGREGPGRPLFSYPAPKVESVAPASADPAGGEELTIRGRNFGPAGARLQVFLGGDTECKDVKQVDGATLTCTVPRGVGKCLSVKVVSGGQLQEADNRFFSYLAPNDRTADLTLAADDTNRGYLFDSDEAVVLFVGRHGRSDWDEGLDRVRELARRLRCLSAKVATLDRSAYPEVAADVSMKGADGALAFFAPHSRGRMPLRFRGKASVEAMEAWAREHVASHTEKSA